MIRVIVPWPHQYLSPNSRIHWEKKSKERRKYRDECHYQAHCLRTPEFGDSEVAVYCLFHPPSERGDLDNMLSSIKAGLDGIAEAWDINDKRFRPITLDSAAADSKEPRVEIFFRKREKKA